MSTDQIIYILREESVFLAAFFLSSFVVYKIGYFVIDRMWSTKFCQTVEIIDRKSTSDDGNEIVVKSEEKVYIFNVSLEEYYDMHVGTYVSITKSVGWLSKKIVKVELT